MAKQIATEPVSVLKLYWAMGGWIALLFVPIFLILTITSFFLSQSAVRFENEGIRAQASVEDRYFTESTDSDGDRDVTYYLVLSFRTEAGQDMNVHRSVGTSMYNQTQIGASVPLWYLRSQPDRIEMSRGESRIAAQITQWVGFAFGLATLAGIWFWGRRAVAAIRAREYGARLSAEVTEITATNITVNDNRLYRLSWVDETGQAGASLAYRRTVLEGIGIGQTIPVYQGLKRTWWEGDVGPRRNA